MVRPVRSVKFGCPYTCNSCTSAMRIIAVGNMKFVKNINLVSEALDTIPPASMESERAFSAAFLLITKFGSRLPDDILDSFSKKLFQESKE